MSSIANRTYLEGHETVAILRRCLASGNLQWAICVPAAFLGSGGRLSDLLSGIEL